MPQAPRAMKDLQEDDLAKELETSLHERHGPVMGGAVLYQALGLPSASALRQAVTRRQVHVRLFEMPNRRGRFALTKDVARWLAQCCAAKPVLSQDGEADAAPQTEGEATM